MVFSVQEIHTSPNTHSLVAIKSLSGGQQEAALLLWATRAHSPAGRKTCGLGCVRVGPGVCCISNIWQYSGSLDLESIGV